MAMTFPYCNTTTDLQSIFKDIERFQGFDTLETFTLVSGQTNTYSKRNTGYIGLAFEDGVALTIQTSIANCESNAGSYYYDSTNDILYIHSTDSADPDTHTITVYSVEKWSDLKDRMANYAFEELESYLDPRYPRPLPFARSSYEGHNYDADIVISAALLTCKNIIQARNPDDPLANKFKNRVWNPADESGILWEYRKGDRSFSFETTKDEFDGNIKRLVIGTNSTGYISLAGKGDRTSVERVIILVTTGGLPGAMKWKYSTDYETNWSDIIDSQADSQYYHLINGIYIKFEGTFVATDKWQLDLVGDEQVTNPKIRSAIIRTNI